VTLTLAPLDEAQRAAIREHLGRTGGAQVDGILAEGDAVTLHQVAAEADYNVVTCRGSGHVETCRPPG